MSVLEDSEQTIAEHNEQEAMRETLASLNRTPEETKSGTEAAEGQAAEDEGFTPIPAYVMRGDPIPVVVGSVDGGLALLLKPVSRRVVRERLAPLVTEWPEVLQFAASVREPANEGVDHEATAHLLNLYRAQQAVAAKSGYDELVAKAQAAGQSPPPMPQGGFGYVRLSGFDVADSVAELTETLDVYQPVICATVLLFTADTMPDMTAEKLWGLLDAHLIEADFADLLRALKWAQGRFKGNFADRFTKPSLEAGTDGGA